MKNPLLIIPMIIAAIAVYCFGNAVKQYFSGSTDGEGKDASDKNVVTNQWYFWYGVILTGFATGIYFWMKSEE